MTVLCSLLVFCSDKNSITIEDLKDKLKIECPIYECVKTRNERDNAKNNYENVIRWNKPKIYEIQKKIDFINNTNRYKFRRTADNGSYYTMVLTSEGRKKLNSYIATKRKYQNGINRSKNEYEQKKKKL